MSPSGKVPVLGWKSASSQDYEHQALFWMGMTKTEPSSRVAALVLHMNSVARQVCTSAGGEHLDNNDGVMCMLEIPRNSPPPEAVDSIFQEWLLLQNFVGRTRRSASISRNMICDGVRRGRNWKWAQDFRNSVSAFCERRQRASSSRGSACAGQLPEEPEGRGCGDGYAEIYRILRNGGSPGGLDYGGCGWARGR